MRFLLALLLAIPSFAAIGDNAQSIPSTYIKNHPRLGYPDNTFLAAVCTATGGISNAGDGCVMSARYRNAAESWDSANPSVSAGGLIQMRRLLIAYAATKAHGTANSNYLTKIKALSNLSGSLSLSNGYWGPSITLSLAYDWTYGDLDSTTRTSMCTSFDTMSSGWEGQFSGASPYNDNFYLSQTFGVKQMIGLLPALAAYPDCAGNSAAHLRAAMDAWFNQVVPVWKQVMGPNGIASSDSDATNGGGWHESWEYANHPLGSSGLNEFYLTSLLAWANASGRGTAYFTVDNPWMKNWAYRMLYQVRPDWIMEPIGQQSRNVFQIEHCPPSGTCPEAGAVSAPVGAYLSSIEGLAEIYNDPTLRGWARLVDWAGQTPDGLEPSAWPYFAPDKGDVAHPTNPKSSSALVKDFPGWGTIFFRTGWGEDDTFCTFRYGDSFWSHPTQDLGAFTCFNRGPLAIRSGTYRSGSAGIHSIQRDMSASQNTLSIKDTNDRYTDETFRWCEHARNNCGIGNCPLGTSGCPDVLLMLPNVGQERSIGSQYSNLGNLAGYGSSPADVAYWMRMREYHHYGRLLAYAVSPSKYTYVAADITASYNNLYARNAHTGAFNPYEANNINHTFRGQKVVRHFLWIPRGQAAYVVVYDQMISPSSNVIKTFLLHSINQPSISGNSYTITRNDLVTSDSFVGAWVRQWSTAVIGSQGLAHCPSGCSTSSTQYQYNGKLYGWATWPTTATLTNKGGPRQSGDAGHDFDLTDSNGTTKNYNECQIAGTSGCGFGSVATDDSISGPFAITSGSNDTLLISVDGGANQTITLTAGAARTAAQVVADINATLTGATATVEGTQQIGISSNKCAAGAAWLTCLTNNTSPSSASIKLVQVANSAYGTLGFGFDITLNQTGPWTFTASNASMSISTNNGAAQAVNLLAAGGCTSGVSCTASTVASTINAQVTGAIAVASGPNLQLVSNTTVQYFNLLSVANSAYSTIGFAVDQLYNGTFQEGLGSVGGFIHPDPLIGPQNAGGWRIEEGTGTTQLADQFVNVMLVTSASDTNVVSTAPVTTLSGNTFTTTWKDNSNTCTYTWTHFLDGVGGTLTIQGAGCSAVVN